MPAITDAERAAMVARYGKPVAVNAELALAWLGIAGVDPADAYAFSYASEEAAIAWAEANLIHQGHASLGIGAWREPGAWVGIIDLRGARG